MTDRDKTSRPPSHADEIGAALDEVVKLFYVFTAGSDSSAKAAGPFSWRSFWAISP
jgi:hypothetical protein